MARRGQAYNLKRAPERVVEQCKQNVNRRLNSKFESYNVYKEVDINNNDIQLDYAIDEPLDDGVPDDKKENSRPIITDEEIPAKIDQIKKPNVLHQLNPHEKIDQNNNIVNNLLSENSLLKER